MAAHLDPVYLRQHAVPVPFMSVADRDAGTPTLSDVRSGAGGARLFTTWQLDSSGRLVGNWSVDTDDPPLMPA